MEVFGNIEALKRAIEKRYENEIKALEEETDKKIQELKKEAEKEIALDKSRIDTLKAAAEKKAYSKVMSEEKLNAKKEFEQKREELINKVFEIAEKEAKKVTRSKEYIAFIKKNIPKVSDKKIEATADSAIYKKCLPSKIKIKIDKNITGIKLREGNITYDLTIDEAIRSKKEVLRHKISTILFGQS